MKHMLLLAATALSIPAFAQRYEIGLNMGMSMSSKIGYKVPGLDNYNSRGGFSPYGSAKFLYNRGRMQYGLGLDFVMPHTSYKDMEAGTTAKVFYARPLVPVYGVANWKMAIGKNSYLYAGASLGIGYSLINTGTTTDYAVNNSAVMPLIGAQLGYAHYFGRIGFNAEAAAKWLPDISNSKTSYSYNIYSGTIGLRYRIGK